MFSQGSLATETHHAKIGKRIYLRIQGYFDYQGRLQPSFMKGQSLEATSVFRRLLNHYPFLRSTEVFSSLLFSGILISSFVSADWCFCFASCIWLSMTHGSSHVYKASHHQSLVSVTEFPFQVFRITVLVNLSYMSNPDRDNYCLKIFRS